MSNLPLWKHYYFPPRSVLPVIAAAALRGQERVSLGFRLSALGPMVKRQLCGTGLVAVCQLRMQKKNEEDLKHVLLSR